MLRDHYSTEDLIKLMALLRTPELGCPWDLQQSYASIAPSTIEEVYEVVDAIEQKDYSQLREELGDLLFQIIFYCQLGSEEKRFDFADVVDTLTRKLISRHPHVFPSGELRLRELQDGQSIPSSEVKANWESLKRKERESKGLQGVLDDVPVALPALSRAAKLQKRAATIGFDWPDVSGVLAAVEEEFAEVQEAIISDSADAIESEMGDLLFSVVNLCRYLKIDPETALRKSNGKFTNRIHYIEQRFAQLQLDLFDADNETLDSFWREAKQQEKVSQR